MKNDRFQFNNKTFPRERKFIAILTVPLLPETQLKNKLNVAYSFHESPNHLRIEMAIECVFELKKIEKS